MKFEPTYPSHWKSKIKTPSVEKIVFAMSDLTRNGLQEKKIFMRKIKIKKGIFSHNIFIFFWKKLPNLEKNFKHILDCAFKFGSHFKTSFKKKTV